MVFHAAFPQSPLLAEGSMGVVAVPAPVWLAGDRQPQKSPEVSVPGLLPELSRCSFFLKFVVPDVRLIWLGCRWKWTKAFWAISVPLTLQMQSLQAVLLGLEYHNLAEC